MNPRWKRTAAALAAALTLTMPAALGADVMVDGSLLSAQQAWVEEGVTYMTLGAYAGHTGRELTWDGSRARLAGEGLELTARPGELYVTANDRALYVPGGVAVVEGQTVLPLRVLAQAAGDTLTWEAETSTVRLYTGEREPASASYAEEDLYWLARVISAESRGEPLLGQIAVGNVVLNRVKESQFPDTIKGVVFDRKNGVQFEPVANGTIHNEPTQSALLAAKLCLEGADVVGDCLYFFAPELSQGKWIVNNRKYHTTIGCHRFYL